MIKIEYGITEMTNTLLELWSCEFTIEGLQTNFSMRAVVQGHIPQFQPDTRMREIDGNAPFSRIRSISRMSKISSKFLYKSVTYTPENTVLASSSDSAYGGQTCFSWLPASGSATEVDILGTTTDAS